MTFFDDLMPEDLNAIVAHASAPIHGGLLPTPHGISGTGDKASKDSTGRISAHVTTAMN